MSDEEDERELVWNAPWERGHVPTPEERKEYAELWTMVLEQLLEHRPTRWQSRFLWVAWKQVFSREEFRDWMEAEEEAYDERRKRERQAKNRRSRTYRQRRKVRTKPH